MEWAARTTRTISLNVVFGSISPKVTWVHPLGEGRTGLDHHPFVSGASYGCFRNFKPISHGGEPRSHPPHLGIRTGRKATTKVRGSKPSNRTCKADSHHSPDTEKHLPATHLRVGSRMVSPTRGSWGSWGVEDFNLPSTWGIPV